MKRSLPTFLHSINTGLFLFSALLGLSLITVAPRAEAKRCNSKPAVCSMLRARAERRAAFEEEQAARGRKSEKKRVHRTPGCQTKTALCLQQRHHPRAAQPTRVVHHSPRCKTKLAVCYLHGKNLQH